MIVVKSANGPENCIIDCQASQSDQHRGFYFASGENQYSVLQGFTIKNGFTTGRGGGIYCSSSSPTIVDCVIANNKSGDMYVYWSGGGGIYCNNSNAKFINCIVSNNYTRNWGGGIWCYNGGAVQMLNCTFIHNKADYVSSMGTWSYGGGISCYNADAEIKNCLIADNWAHDFSGGISFNRSNATLKNCTIVNNQADERVGGVYLYLSNVNIENSITWGNIAPGSEQLRSASSTLTVSYCNIQVSWPGLGNLAEVPCFANQATYDYHLKSQAGRWDPVGQTWVIDSATSPCIDSGNPGCPLGDEPNDINNVRINMGAYGGTVEASMSPANWHSIADLDNDWTVNYNDLKIYTDYWLDTGESVFADLDRSGDVNLVDYSIFSNEWIGN